MRPPHGPHAGQNSSFLLSNINFAYCQVQDPPVTLSQILSDTRNMAGRVVARVMPSDSCIVFPLDIIGMDSHTAKMITQIFRAGVLILNPRNLNFGIKFEEVSVTRTIEYMFPSPGLII